MIDIKSRVNWREKKKKKKELAVKWILLFHWVQNDPPQIKIKQNDKQIDWTCQRTKKRPPKKQKNYGTGLWLKPVVDGTRGTVPKDFEGGLKELEIFWFPIP